MFPQLCNLELFSAWITKLHQNNDLLQKYFCKKIIIINTVVLNLEYTRHTKIFLNFVGYQK